ncbi:hypothetical protein CsSME_00051169 [Camellia sinensis var. sinensis]
MRRPLVVEEERADDNLTRETSKVVSVLLATWRSPLYRVVKLGLPAQLSTRGTTLLARKNGGKYDQLWRVRVVQKLGMIEPSKTSPSVPLSLSQTSPSMPHLSGSASSWTTLMLWSPIHKSFGGPKGGNWALLLAEVDCLGSLGVRPCLVGLLAS